MTTPRLIELRPKQAFQQMPQCGDLLVNGYHLEKLLFGRAWRCWGESTNSGRMAEIIHPPFPPEEYPHACQIATRHMQR